MNIRNKIALGVVVALLFWIIFSVTTSSKTTTTKVELPSEDSATSTEEVTTTQTPATTETPTPSPTTQPQVKTAPVPVQPTQTPQKEKPVSPKDPEPIVDTNPYWAVINMSMLALKIHDLDTYNTLQYKTTIDCDVESKTCTTKMDDQYTALASLSQNWYSVAWVDNKQAILSSKMYDGRSGGRQYYAKDFIYFIQNESGSYKVLKIFTNSIDTTSKTDAITYFLDTDKDGSTDAREGCVGKNSYDPLCKKTDVLKRDSDSDGWWDGIEDYL
jgi:hypothetical protein